MFIKKEMPYYRKRRRSSKSRSRKGRPYKRKFYRRKNFIVQNPIPNSRLVRFRYCPAGISIDPAVGLAATYVFRCNSLYDPDYTGVGHQPMGYDEMTTLYSRSTVISSKIQVTFISPGSAVNSGTAVVGIRVDTNPTTSADTELNMENIPNNFRVLGNSAQAGVTLSETWSLKKYAGKRNYREDSVSEVMGGGVVGNVMYYQVFAGAVFGTDDPGAIRILPVIEYVAILWDPNTLLKS